MAAADRFSDLPDDLLVHVISFLPVRDAARTAALSRRWRPLWLHTGTINLDSRPYSSSHNHTTIHHRRIRRRLFGDATSALSAARIPVTRITVFVEGDEADDLENVLGCSQTMGERRHRRRHPRSKGMDTLLADPAMRRVEELRVGFKLPKESSRRFIYKMPPGVLPAMAGALKVLDLDYCYLELPPQNDGAAFPRLASLRLDRCSMPAPHLAALIRAAPNLAALHVRRLEFFVCGDGSAGDQDDKDRLCLHCPNLTALTLDELDIFTPKPIELLAPCLRTFSYNGHFIEFTMKSDAPNLTRADLKFFNYFCELNNASVLVWQFLCALRHTKAMKLAVDNIDYIALDKDDERLAIMFPRLERLELEAAFDAGDTERATAAMATLLRCCPVIRDLKLRLEHCLDWARCLGKRRRRDESAPFEIPVDFFKRRRIPDEIALMLDDDDDDSSGVVDLPDLTGCWFNCFDDHLKNVELRFRVKEACSVEIRRAKFLGENLKALEVRASNR